MSNVKFDPNGVIPDNGNYFGIPIAPEQAALVLISAPWDTTVSMRAGSSYAPDAIIEASRRIDFFDPIAPNTWRKGIATLPVDYSIQDLSHRMRSEAVRVIKVHEDIGSTAFDHLVYERRLRRVNEASAEVNANIYAQARRWLRRNKIVGLVGGDQSTAYGLIRATGEYHPSFGILHIDSCCDLKPAYQGFEHSHASIMYNVLRDVPEISRLVSVGVRSFSPAEWERAESDERIKLYTGQQLYKERFEGVTWSDTCSRIVDDLPEKVYLSFDIDGLTIECSPNTGTIITGGLRYPEVVYLINRVVESGRQIVGFDLTEVVPAPNCKTDATIAARLLFSICSIALKPSATPDVL